MRLRLEIAATAATIVSIAFGAAPVALGAVEPPPPQIEVLSPEKIEVSADKTETVEVLIRNAGGSPIVVGFEVNGEYAPEVTPESGEVLGYSVRRFSLNFTPTTAGKEVSGELIASGKDTAPAGIAFSSSTKQATPWWIYAILFASLAAALLLVSVRWFIGEYPRKATLTGRIGPANWDFTKSWGSTLTAVGALLGTIIAASVLPDKTVVPKTTYAGLNLFFGALIVIAPFIYTATQTAAPFHRTKTVKEPQFQGYVWSFLLATALTLWAVLGELGSILAVFNEIRVGGTMPQVTLWILAVLLAISAVLLLQMSWRRIGTIVEFQSDRKKQRKRQLELNPQRLAGLVAEDTPGETTVEPELPSWSLL